MTTEVTSIGVGMETDGVERGIRTLQQLAAQGPKVEKSMEGISSSVEKSGQSLSRIGGSSQGLRDVADGANKARDAIGSMGASTQSAITSAAALERAMSGLTAVEEKYIKSLYDEAKILGASRGDKAAYIAQSKGMSASAHDVARAIGNKIEAIKEEQAAASKYTSIYSAATTSIQGFMGLQIVSWMKQSASAIYEASAAAERLRISLDFSSIRGSANEIAYLRRATTDLGLSFAGTSVAYQQFQAAAKGTAIEGEKARSIFEAISKASAVMGLSADQSAGALLALQQMVSKGTVQAEELRGQLGERLPGAFQIAARSMGVTTAELGKMLEQGQVIADDFLPKFAMELERSLGDAPEKAANRLDASVNRVSNSWERLKANVGESGTSSFMAGQMNILSDAMGNFNNKIEAARQAGAGFGGQLLAAAGAAAEFINPVNAISYSALEAGNKLKEAEQRLQELKDSGAKASSNLMLREAYKHAERLVNKLREAKKAQDDLAGGGLGGAYTEGMGSSSVITRQREAEAKSEKDLIELRMRTAGINKQYFTDLKTLQDALSIGTLTNDQYVKSVSELAKRTYDASTAGKDAAKAQREAAKGAGAAENAYTSLSKKVGDYIQQLRIEALQGDKATAAQKAQIQLNDLLANSKGKVTAAKVSGLQADIQTALLMEKEAKATKLAADQAEEAAKAYDAVLERAEKRADALRKQVQTEQDATAAIGLSKDAIASLEAAKYSDLAASKEREAVTWSTIDLSGEMTRKLQEEAQAYRDLAGAKIQRGIKQANYDTAKQAEKDWEKVSETIGRSLSDYIMGGGKDAAQYLKRLFSTLVLQPIVQTAVGNVFGQGASGVSGVASSAGGIGKLASTASNVNTLLGLSGSGAAFGSLGVSNAVGMAGGDALGALISTNATNWGVTAGSSLMGAIGTALPWVAGGLAIASLFGGDLMGSLFGRKLKDSGIEGTFGGDQGFTGNTFEYYKGGVFRSDKTVRNPLEEGTRSQFADQFTGAQSAIKTMGDTLGLITGAVDSATYSIKLSLKGLSEDDAAKAIQAEFDRITESMASLVLTTNEYSLADEKRIETLARLSGSLTAFNGSLDQLGLAAYDASLKSADAAYKIISAFGGLENYGQALQSYYQNFYSEAEQLAKITETVTNALGQYGAKLPETAEAYRAMVEAQLLAAQYGDDKAAEFAATLIGMSGNFKLISDAWKKELDGMADSIASVFSGIKDEISSVLADVAGTRKDILRGTGVMTPAEIQSAINAAMVYAPSTSGLVRAQGNTAAASAAYASAKAIADRSAAAAANASVIPATQNQIAASESQKAGLQARRKEITDLFDRVAKKNQGWNQENLDMWRQKNIDPQLKDIDRQIAALEPGLAKLRAELAQQQAAAAMAGGISAADAAKVAEAKKALEAAQKAEVKAKAEYAAQMNKFVQDAGGSVGKLSDLRGEVVSFYEAQVQAVEKMLQSASNLRNVVDTVRLGQLTTAQTARELGNRYAMDYSMALSTTGTTRAGYVDAMASNLQSLTQAIKAEAISSTDYQIQTAKLLAQASNAAGLLEGDAETVDFQDTALDLLDSIDAALKNLEATTKTGEQIIADAVYNGTASTLNGLRAVVAALKGDPIPAFAVGTNYVPRDMLAQIHEGEAIVPKAFNPWAGGGMSASGGGNSKQLEVLMEQLIDEQRVQASRQVELQMQMNKQLQRWDAIGMPEVREV